MDSTTTRVTVPGADYRAVAGKTQNRNDRNGLNFNNNLLFRHKFHTIGRTLTLGWNNSFNNSDGDGSTIAPLLYYNRKDSVIGNQNQNLVNDQSTRANNNVASLSYTEPLGKNKLIELNYAYTNNHSTSDRDVFDYDQLTGKYDKINTRQTNYFKNDYTGHRYGTNFRLQVEKYNFQLGGAVQTSTQSNMSLRPIAVTGKDSTIRTRQTFVNLFPTANFTYNFSRTKNFRFFYRGRTNQPNISQLQDAPDYSDPTVVRNGNPLLKPEFSNNININYSSFNPLNFKFINANINLGQTSNKIVNSINYLPKRLDSAVSSSTNVQYIVPVNLNGSRNASSYVTLGIPLRGKMRGSNINFNNNISYNRDASKVLNDINYTQTFLVSQSAGINLDFKEKLNFGLTGRLAYNSTKYSIPTINNNAEYYTQTYSANVNYYIRKTLILATDFDLVKNTGLGEGYDQVIPLWNASLAQLLFKKKNGELRFSVNDILNQNKSIARTSNDNYIEDTRTVVLKRYFMLTFTYSLNRAGSRGNQQQRDMQFPGRRGQGQPGGDFRNRQNRDFNQD